MHQLYSQRKSNGSLTVAFFGESMKFVNKNQFEAADFAISAMKCLEMRRETPAPLIIDIRGSEEYRAAQLAGANNLPAEFLEDNLMQLPPFAPLVLYGNADDAPAVASIKLLKDNGFDEIFYVTGGYPALLEALKSDENEIFLSDLPEGQWGAKIEEVLDLQVRPALASDGGGLAVNKIDGAKVYINYQGACSGCASSTTGTLKFIQSTLQISLNHPIEVISV